MQILLLLLLFAAGFSVVLSQDGTGSPTRIKVRKCCPDGKRLDSSDPTDPRCVQHSFNLQFQEMDIVGLDLTKDPSSRRVNLTLEYETGSAGMPQCKGAKVFTVLMENSWLTAKGNLVQDSQEHQMRHYEFCVDHDTDGKLGAVSCDACTEDHPCVNLCCPHGTALVEDPTRPQMEICGTETLNETFSPEFWTEHDKKMQEYGKEHGFILKAPANLTKFACPHSLMPDPLHAYPGYDHSSYVVKSDGRLYGYNISYMHQKAPGFGNFSWDNNKFCVSYADMLDYESDYESDGEFQLTYNACYDNSPPPKCEDHLKFLSYFNPISLSISICFLLLTIGIFFWYKNINMRDRSNMMKIAFLINLTIAYIVSVWMWAQDDNARGKSGCKIVGYLLQHFFLGAIFWINAMGFHIWRLFNVGGSKKPFREDLKKFLFYALYAQGLPLLINIITFIIDSSKDKITSHYPNMGAVRCFLGEDGTTKMKHPHYFESAKFIYHDLFMFIVQLINGVFLFSIGKVLRRGWKNQAERLELIGEDKKSFQDMFKKAANNGVIVLRIFVILGVPWVFELISTIIGHYYDECQPVIVSVIIFITDLFVLFAGFFIFLTMIAKKEYMRGIKEQLTESFSSCGMIKPSTPDNGGSQMMTAMSEVNSASR